MAQEFVIAGRYVLSEQPELLLGRGGMGEVYLGRDRETDTPVAIKALRSDRIARADETSRMGVLLERFSREGEILRELAHPNIVQMLAVDVVDDRQFLIMEYVPGGSLRERLDTGAPLTLVKALQMALEIADALGRVHHLGIVHRDIKPDNILLMNDGTPRVTDFGVAHLASVAPVTGAGAILGTLAYLSPEACTGLPVDARSDIWSFGVVLYEMLVGRTPFLGDTAVMIVAAISSGPTPPVERAGEKLPRALVRLVNKMLTKDRDERMSSARKVAAELESILVELERPPPKVVRDPPKASTGTLAGTIDSAQFVVPEPLASEDPQISPERRTELRLLEKVHRHWIAGVLEQANAERARMRLPARRCYEKIELPWEHLGTAFRDRQLVDIGSDPVELFDATDRALLILGEAGGGKSTLLLELANTLLERSMKQAQDPLPVVLSLSSWTRQSGDLSSWIVDELVAKYQLPRRLGRAWLESERLLLLLDDFVGEVPGCVNAINEFREQHGMSGIVVCGRTETHAASDGKQLRLGGAIELLSPSEEEVERALGEVEPRLIQILEKDPALRELVRSPLMLTLLRGVFSSRGDSDDGSESENERENENESTASTTSRGLRADTGDERPLRERLFASFVRRSLRGGPPGLERATVREQLSEFAAGMSANNQRMFLIEQLQPSWLRSRAHQWLYLALSRGFAVLFITCSIWLVHELLMRFGVPEPLSRVHVEGARALGWPGALGELVTLGLIGLIATPALVLADGLVYERRRKRGPPASQEFDLRLVGLRLAVLFIVLVGLLKTVDTWVGAVSTVSIVLILNIFMLVQRGSPSFSAEVQPVEALGWSWGQAAKWGALAVPLNLGPAAVLWWMDFPIQIISFVVVTGVLFVFVCAGLQHRELDARSKPNLGTTLSMRNAIYAGLLVGGAQVPLYLLWWHSPWTMVVGVMTASMVSALSFGLLAVIQHMLLRLLLTMSGQLPLHLERPLDHAVSCGLMRRVGGGYMFTSPLLQDYFASLPKSG
ncbi:Serine/threonine protein kinase [Enhygromyxa salina]|uniref:Serine/threonine protein kinase n=1 Tax=Enhygromyxa salina TaxID=215803 RepID=A0A0C1ZLZ7_9BACT|nr:serine/threonine-protein kinase [Enhygromyxa salina]KIG11873.1 Serine/threonine protein kinase [Enhygromyxa salina]